MTQDVDLLAHISALVEEEHALHGAGASARRTEIEVALDQCWDLLRQRQAKREFGQDPDAAALRPPSEVEGYRQ